MENKPQFLVSADEVNCEIYCNALTQNKIKFEVRDSDIKAAYAGASFLEKDIFVMNSDLKKARKIIGLNGKLNLFKQKPLWFRIIAVGFLAFFIFTAIMLIISAI